MVTSGQDVARRSSDLYATSAELVRRTLERIDKSRDVLDRIRAGFARGKSRVTATRFAPSCSFVDPMIANSTSSVCVPSMVVNAPRGSNV
jgi:hypothetical protein